MNHLENGRSFVALLCILVMLAVALATCQADAASQPGFWLCTAAHPYEFECAAHDNNCVGYWCQPGTFPLGTILVPGGRWYPIDGPGYGDWRWHWGGGRQ